MRPFELRPLPAMMLDKRPPCECGKPDVDHVHCAFIIGTDCIILQATRTKPADHVTLTDKEALELANTLTRGRIEALVRLARIAQRAIDVCGSDELVRDFDTALLAFRGEFEP